MSLMANCKGKILALVSANCRAYEDEEFLGEGALLRETTDDCDTKLIDMHEK